MLEIVPGLQNRSMHFLHRIAQLDTKPAQNVPLPRIILGVDPRLDLLIINHAHAKRFLGVRSVECRPRLLDLRQQLLPVRQRVSESVEHVFGLEVP